MSHAPRPCPLDWSAVAALTVDAFAVFVAEDERPLWGLGGLLDWQMCAALSKHLRAGLLHGRADEALLMTGSHALAGSRLFAFGLGGQGETTGEQFARRAKSACDSLRKAGVRRVAVGVPEKPGVSISAPILLDALRETSLEAWVVGPLEVLEPVFKRATT